MKFCALLFLLKKSESASSLCHSPLLVVCPHCWRWIYSWRWAVYFSPQPPGCGTDILQPSHVLHKNCQWVRSEDLSKTTGALMHSNMLHYNDNSHQQYERGSLAWKDGGRGVIKCLPLPNRQLSCQSHKSNQRLIASLFLPRPVPSLLSLPFLLELLPLSPSSVCANKQRATVRFMQSF